MAAPISIINDVGTLMKIPTKVSTEITDKACLCIGSAIAEAKQKNETQLSIGIGIGTLSINLVDMQCKFVPGKNLKATIKTALTEQINPVETVLEQTLAEKLLAICKEVL